MHYYKTTIQYAGTQYAGFQWQNGLRTVQDEINKALAQLIDGKVTTRAASRTDTGVHAIDQVVKISSALPIECETFLESFNHHLPQDIKCQAIAPCGGTFKPAAEALSKEYRYFFTNKKQVSLEDRQFIANIANELDIAAMQTCLKGIIGKHDFCNFYSIGSNVKTTEREISFCELTEINPHEIFIGQTLFHIPNNLQSCYQLRIEANGFLKQMIRHLMSALWMVGSKKLSIEEFLALIDGQKKEKQLWKVASPNGLYLYKISYPRD